MRLVIIKTKSTFKKRKKKKRKEKESKKKKKDGVSATVSLLILKNVFYMVHLCFVCFAPPLTFCCTVFIIIIIYSFSRGHILLTVTL